MNWPDPALPVYPPRVRNGTLFALALALALASIAGCAYPRRTTSLSLVRGSSESSSTPSDVWSLTVSSGQIPPQSRGALGWDGTDGLPDCFVRIYRGEELVYESPTIQDSLTPEWNAALPHNFYAPRDTMIRFEIWDRDEVGADPVGIYRNRGLPANVVPGADGRVMLEGGAQLSLHLQQPVPHRGVGIRLYEVQPDALVVLEVETHSPAGRGGIQAGDAIIAIGGQSVSSLGGQRAPGALSMASERHEVLRVRSANGTERDVELDRGFTWLVM